MPNSPEIPPTVIAGVSAVLSNYGPMLAVIPPDMVAGSIYRAIARATISDELMIKRLRNIMEVNGVPESEIRSVAKAFYRVLIDGDLKVVRVK